MSDLGLLLSDDPNDRHPTLRMGIVTQRSPLKVRIGDEAGVEAIPLANYAPAEGHRVMVLIVPGFRLVIGNV